MKILKVTEKILIGETQSSFQKNLIIGLLILLMFIYSRGQYNKSL